MRAVWRKMFISDLIEEKINFSNKLIVVKTRESFRRKFKLKLRKIHWLFELRDRPAGSSYYRFQLETF